ncbi:GDP-fucose protein O-fucosyltransferase [Artemisia annua]|uniref:O-fucosyltransferase family protein n=1 Tax=Artemisia annua TaxID=35608 RepID=A0A2U1MPA8_ARTAN|nr:GDP-fucose protein O-fucosyltransferase [Artemisia annua]
MDVRQVMAAVLTFSMFVMLGNMIKRDHFDGDVLLNVPVASNVNDEQDYNKMSRHSLYQLNSGVPKKDGPLRLCWNNSSMPKGREESKGVVTFSLTDGPEYHIAQVANVVLIAKHLGATLVLPEIIGSKGEKRDFEEIYDAEKFMTSMSGIVRVERRKRPTTLTEKLVSIKVPYNAKRDYIARNIEPLFKATQKVRVITYFPSATMKDGKVDNDMNPYSCWATFKALRLKPELQEILDSITKRLRSHDSHQEFVAIDYKGEMLGTTTCRSNANKGMKNCYNLFEIAQFLQRIGSPRDATIYLTHSKTDHSLSPIKDIYPKTFTKDDIMEKAEKAKFSKLEQEIIDFHLCTVSDVFVPAKSGLFYSNVIGHRIAASRTDVLVPAQITSALAQDHISSYISKRSHPAYACFCH